MKINFHSTKRILNNNEHVLNISIKHKGFIKYAIEYGRPIIPILSFGEQDLLTVTKWNNSFEKWVKEHINNRFVFPWFSGKYGLPIPRNTPITCVIGKPMNVKQIKNPTQKVINKYHKKFYNRIKQLFHRYKDHPDVRVKYTDIRFIHNDCI